MGGKTTRVVSTFSVKIGLVVVSVVHYPDTARKKFRIRHDGEVDFLMSTQEVERFLSEVGLETCVQAVVHK